MDETVKEVAEKQSLLIDQTSKELLVAYGFKDEEEARRNGYELMVSVFNGVGGETRISIYKLVESRIVPEIKIITKDKK